jgi:hypothetical protein
MKSHPVFWGTKTTRELFAVARKSWLFSHPVWFAAALLFWLSNAASPGQHNCSRTRFALKQPPSLESLRTPTVAFAIGGPMTTRRWSSQCAKRDKTPNAKRDDFQHAQRLRLIRNTVEDMLWLVLVQRGSRFSADCVFKGKLTKHVPNSEFVPNLWVRK